jgi:hypothetical protein
MYPRLIKLLTLFLLASCIQSQAPMTLSGIVDWGGKVTFNPAVASGSTQLFTDNFNRANENPLAGNWTQGFGQTDTFSLNANAANSTSGNDCAAYYNAITWPDDQYMEVKCSPNASGAGSGYGLAMRMDTATKSLYRIVIDNAGNIDIARIDSGTYNGLATRSVSFVTGGTLRVEVTGSATVTIKVFWQGVQAGANITDSSANRRTTGKAGISFSSTNGGSEDDAAGGSIP